VRSRLESLSPRVRAAALMPAAVLTVHQLRYLLAFGGNADGKLAEQGHAYLGAVAPAAAMLVAIAVGVLIAGLARARRDGAAPEASRGLSFTSLALLVAVSLLGIYAAQELAEGALVAGHPGGLVGVFGSGGWWALPLSLALGALVALALRAADAALRWAASRARRARAQARAPRRSRRPAPFFVPQQAPLATAAAGRAPPPALALNH
jgi:hypothetical protein